MKKNYKENAPKRKHYARIYSSQKRAEEKYNRPVKNIIREKIIDLMSNYQIKNLLTLESKDFIFTKLIPEKKVYIFERDKNEFDNMQHSKPKNVILNFGDISDFKEFDLNVDFIYLDFCTIYNSNKETLFLLKEKIQKAKLFAITLCTRDSFKDSVGDYQFDLLNKLQTLLGINFKILFGQGYRDNRHSTMVTIIMENPNEV
jgi:hypothetical protein